jgi:hypothetical protein
VSGDRVRRASLIPQDAQPIEAAIACLAGEQRCVQRAQLLGLGLSRSGIARRLRSGYLYREHAGVYAVGCPARSPAEHAAAAVLACEPGYLAAAWALALWGFAPWPLGEPHVLTTADHRRPGIVVHKTLSLSRGETRRRHGIPVTSPARAVLDAAPLLSQQGLTRAVNDGLRTPRLERVELARVRAAHPLHPGAKLLLPFIDTSDGPTFSDWEDRLPGQCIAYGLPVPRMSAYVCGHLVDAVFDDAKLIIELDSWEFHRDRESFENDRDRDADTLAGGYATVRMTWERIERQTRREMTRLKAIIERRLRYLGK